MLQAHRTHPSVLEISTRSWLFDLAKKRNETSMSLSQIPDSELSRFKNLGMDFVWLMGVWKLGHYGPEILEKNVDWTEALPDYTPEDIIGSPYAVSEYSVNPTIGTVKELVDFRQRLHAYGLRLMLDFVPNHTALDSPWVSAHPEFFIHLSGNSQKVAHGNKEWHDTAQLNYWNPKTADFMLEQFLAVLSLCDGARCDMAHLLLNKEISRVWSKELGEARYLCPQIEFWQKAVPVVKAQFPEAVLLAEVYGSEKELIHMGFDYVYCKQFYDLLVGNERNYFMPHLDNIRNFLDSYCDYLPRFAFFIENHDEPRAVGDRFAHWKRANAAAAVIATLPGLKLYYDGQFENHHRLLVQLRRAKAPLSFFYSKLVPLLDQPILHYGQWTFLQAYNNKEAWRLLCWSWHLQEKNTLLLAAINYTGDGKAAGLVRVNIPGEGVVTYTDVLSNKKYTYHSVEARENGIYVELDIWEVQLLLFTF